MQQSEMAGFPGAKLRDLKGENGWQSGAVQFMQVTNDPLALHKFMLIEGAEPSYNNVRDHDRLLQTITHIAAAHDLAYRKVPFIAVGCKHGNPCGAATGHDRIEVMKKMMAGDPLAIFGGLIMTNFSVDEDVAKAISTKLDGIIAPGVTEGAIDSLRRKKDKCRFMTNSALGNLDRTSLDHSTMFRQVRGGYLVQPNYDFIMDLDAPNMAAYSVIPGNSRDRDLLLAWAIGSTSNSNTITLVRDCQLLGNGVGQQSRVAAARLAITRARDSGHETADAVAYSDSFFPNKDGVEALIEAGVTAILTSSGSIVDTEIIVLCQQRDITLYMIPDQDGRGFFGH